MIIFWVFAFVCIAPWQLVLGQSPMTYWVDGTCSYRPLFFEILDDAKLLASKAFQRNGLKERDVHFQWAFEISLGVTQDSEQIFHSDNGHHQGTPWQLVNYVFSVISRLTRTYDQTTSHVRFYCDDDEADATPNSQDRWQLVPDRVDDPLPNSQKHLGVDQEWFDQYNWMRRPTDSQGCKDTDPEADLPQHTLMQTYTAAMTAEDLVSFSYNGRQPPPNLEPKRCTVTICDLAIYDTGEIFEYITWNYFPAEKPWEDFGMSFEIYRMVLSSILLHELTHIRGLDTLDVAGSESYGWRKIVAFPPAMALQNGDNFMYLAILAELLDWKLRLHEDRRRAVDGDLVRDTSIEALVKRAVKDIDRAEKYIRYTRRRHRRDRQILRHQV